MFIILLVYDEFVVVLYLPVAFRSICSFFFFKQKTAYEMRISGRSSDVCSSDLQVHRREQGLTHTGLRRWRTNGTMTGPTPSCEIGRASCREGVCQYV